MKHKAYMNSLVEYVILEELKKNKNGVFCL